MSIVQSRELLEQLSQASLYRRTGPIRLKLTKERETAGLQVVPQETTGFQVPVIHSSSLPDPLQFILPGLESLRRFGSVYSPTVCSAGLDQTAPGQADNLEMHS